MNLVRKERSHFLGIDPGVSGGIVRVDEAGRLVDKDIIPIFETTTKKGDKRSLKREIDVNALGKIFNKHADVLFAYLEAVHAHPGQGVVSMFTFGRAFGLCEMGLAATGIPYKLVTPQAWAKAMHAGVSKEYDAKTRSKIVISRAFPDIDLRASERARTPHEGLMDAFLLAHHALQTHAVHGAEKDSTLQGGASCSN